MKESGNINSVGKSKAKPKKNISFKQGGKCFSRRNMKYTHTHNTVTILKSQIPPVGKFPANSIKDGAARPPPSPTEETISAPSSEQHRKGHGQEIGWDTSNVSLNISTYKVHLQT